MKQSQSEGRGSEKSGRRKGGSTQNGASKVAMKQSGRCNAKVAKQGTQRCKASKSDGPAHRPKQKRSSKREVKWSTPRAGEGSEALLKKIKDKRAKIVGAGNPMK